MQDKEWLKKQLRDTAIQSIRYVGYGKAMKREFLEKFPETQVEIEGVVEELVEEILRTTKPSGM